MNQFFGGAAANDPISQFKIKSLLDIDVAGFQLDFTNALQSAWDKRFAACGHTKEGKGQKDTNNHPER